MFVLDLVPAWFSNRIKRLVKAPKRYLVDPALVAAVLAELAASSNDPRL
jgi:predicted AAA+ superfamily ATPase